MSSRLAVVASLAFFAWPAAAQAPLKLPTTQGEIRALLRETSDPICVRCGVVSSVRRVPGASVGASAGASAATGAQPLPGSSTLESGIAPVPVLGEGARAERDALRREAPNRYEVVVRYDDGSYGRVELGNDPRLRPGDRVKLEGDHLERYP
jgi:hypothetical protein